MCWATLCFNKHLWVFLVHLVLCSSNSREPSKIFIWILFSFLFGPLYYGGPLKWPVCQFVCLSVNLAFFVIEFFWFFAQWQITWIFKNWQSKFLQENLFLPKFGQREPKMVLKWSFWIFLKYFGISFSWYI